jgi:hypothetical protein
MHPTAARDGSVAGDVDAPGIAMRPHRFRGIVVATAAIVATAAFGASLDVPEAPASKNPWACAKEKACIRSSGGLAQRSGATLRIKALNGKIVTFEDSSPDCSPNEEAEPPVECPAYRLVGYVRGEMPYFLIREITDSTTHQVISAQSGEEVYSRMGEAAFSPDGKRLVSFLSSGELASFDMEIANLETGKAQVEFRADADDQGATGRNGALKGWTSNNRIEFTFVQNSDDRERTVSAAAVRKNSTWKIERKQP